MSPLPANVTVSNHPCLKVKLSQLRSATCSPKQTRALVKEISLLLACDALRSVLSVEEEGTVCIPFEPCSVSYPAVWYLSYHGSECWVISAQYTDRVLYIGYHTSRSWIPRGDSVPKEDCVDPNSSFWPCHG